MIIEWLKRKWRLYRFEDCGEIQPFNNAAQVRTDKEIDWAFSGMGITCHWIEGPVRPGLRLYRTSDSSETFTTVPTCPYCGVKPLGIDEGFFCVGCERRY